MYPRVMKDPNQVALPINPNTSAKQFHRLLQMLVSLVNSSDKAITAQITLSHGSIISDC